MGDSKRRELLSTRPSSGEQVFEVDLGGDPRDVQAGAGRVVEVLSSMLA
ncbi:MAG TPA: hypothetical protein VF129_10650 [Actinomycetota bacterium]